MPATSRLFQRPGFLVAAGFIAALVCLTMSAAASAATPKRLALVLPLVANTAGLERFAAEVSTPGNALYGHYESIGELSRRFGASAAAKATAISYLKENGATDIRTDATGLFIDATLPTATAERLFGTQERELRSSRGSYTVPTSTARIPSPLAGIVSGVVGLDTQPVAVAPDLRRSPDANPFLSVTAPITDATDFGSGTIEKSDADHVSSAALTDHADASAGTAYTPESGTPSGCAAAQQAHGFTPNQYLSAYDFNQVQNGGRTIGQDETVALIEIDGFISKDVETFARCFGLHLPKIVGFAVGAGVGADGLVPGGESDLDLEVLTAAAPGLRSIDVYETESDASSVLTALTAPLQNTGYEPQVISASLGLCEQQTYEAVGHAGIDDTEAALAEASAAGISFLAASGDDGSADCLPTTGQSNEPLPERTVNYPASSAWATGVGGTNLGLNSANQIVASDVWNDADEIPGEVGAGGGGISAIIAHPSYQDGVVTSAYRAVPDVALLADVAPGYDVYCTADDQVSADGCYDPEAPEDCNAASADPNCPWQPFGGTSAATPLMAGGVALIDQLLRERKKQDLGLLNPLLYQLGKNAANDTGSIFYDVTTGSNDVGPYITGYGQPLGCCTAATGYDEASGWGGVNLDGLAKAALASQPAVVNIAQTFPRGQHPIAKGELVDKITCSGHCRMGAFVVVTIPGHKSETIFSGLYTLTKRSSREVGIHFTRAELAEFRAALAHGKVIDAAVYGAIVDPARNIERQTSGVHIHLSS